jgi:hypothetical protein
MMTIGDLLAMLMLTRLKTRLYGTSMRVETNSFEFDSNLREPLEMNSRHSQCFHPMSNKRLWQRLNIWVAMYAMTLSSCHVVNIPPQPVRLHNDNHTSLAIRTSFAHQLRPHQISNPNGKCHPPRMQRLTRFPASCMNRTSRLRSCH